MTDLLTARLTEVRRRILNRADAALEDIHTVLDAAERGEAGQPDRERVCITIHNLAGTSGSVGLKDVSRAARDLDRAVGSWLRGQASATSWRTLYETLAMAMAEARTKETFDA